MHKYTLSQIKNSSGFHPNECFISVGPLGNLALHQHAEDMLYLLEQAFDRFTDNDMQPPNAQLRKWLDTYVLLHSRVVGKEL